MLAALLGLIVAALFSGAALYINVAEQPARLQLDDRALLAEWTPAYAAGTRMQAPLAGMGFLLGTLAWWQTSLASFAFAALAMLANIPWTLLVIMPVNRRLSQTEPLDANAVTRALVQQWARLHAVRTLFGFVALAAFVIGLRR